jgi:hypothetical protein
MLNKDFPRIKKIMNNHEVKSAVEKAVKISNDRTSLWTNILSELDCRCLCEVGVWKGEFVESLLQSLNRIESYTLIDPWKNLPNWNKSANMSDIEFERIHDEAMKRVTPYKEKIIEIRDTTKNARKKIENGSLDFVYIDGDHTLRGITIDLNAMLSKVRKYGFIGGDDFTKTLWQHGDQYSPTEVFPYAIYFAEANDLKIYTLPFNQFLIFNDSGGFDLIDYGNYSNLTPIQIYSKPRSLNRYSILHNLIPNNLKKYLKR